MTGVADIAALIDNPLTHAEGRRFAAILGASPSRGARSPALWNAAFAAHEIDAVMVPLDVPRERVGAVLSALDDNPCFMGGAVAAPHKEAVAAWLGPRVTPEASAIGAVNCLYRDESGRLMGTNTDGEGALASFQARFGPVAGRSVLLMGPGGAGKAVAVFFRRAAGAAGRLSIAGRSPLGRQYADRLGCDWVEWPDVPAGLADADVLINCTSVGSASRAGASPVTADALAYLPDRAVVFDIIYDPSPTPLLALAAGRGLPTLDGSTMNLEQAVLAYGHAAPEPRGCGATRAAMERARR
jgi:shikimate dehydrogenase